MQDVHFYMSGKSVSEDIEQARHAPIALRVQRVYTFSSYRRRLHVAVSRPNLGHARI